MMSRRRDRPDGVALRDPFGRPGVRMIETPLAGYTGWKVQASVAERDGDLVVLDAAVVPGYPQTSMPGGIPTAIEPPPPDPQGITTEMLRAVRLGDVLTLAHDAMRFQIDAARLPRLSGRQQLSDRDLAVWAARYVDEASRSNKPVAELAKRYREKPARIRDVIHACRKELLTPAPKGRAGGDLTPKARALLPPGAIESKDPKRNQEDR